ncbi:COA8 family protein CBG23705, mitochondrial-like [Mercenaria mercenaria]|uniref:COA8 family protein CBG23705, mitochondrial-like n=1 Tax=Mercenaria mercenaria TaxID=6596 RepID=UPI00234F12E8|nr:COA8 family protein CBG23705, mitochondrial-like [Mercenaria mercenaria]
MAAPMKRFCSEKCFAMQKCLFVRYVSVPHSKQTHSQKSPELTAPPPEVRENDWIGPPDKVSNIRQMEFYIPEGETDIEKKYREKRQSVLEWHHEFWTEHNKNFFTQKEEFTQQRLAEKQKLGVNEDSKSVSAEELSEFYKKFLDDNYKTHIKYNKEWYKKNVMLLWPAVKVNVIRMMSLRKKNSQNNT